MASPFPAGHIEKRGVVGGEKGRVVVQNRPDDGRFFECLGQEPPHPITGPAPGMDKLPIQGKVAFIIVHRIQAVGLAAVGRKIEDGQENR
jgi:hypothetical protein